MILPLCFYGNPILRKKSRLVESLTPEIIQFIQDLKETLISHENGWGIAANQVGKDLRIFATYEININEQLEPVQTENIIIYINPKILSYSQDLVELTEGCLSIPGLYEDVERPASIEVEYQDEQGQLQKATLTHYQARVFLHENDHINGVLFVDRLDTKAKAKCETRLREIKKKHA